MGEVWVWEEGYVNGMSGRRERACRILHVEVYIILGEMYDQYVSRVPKIMKIVNPASVLPIS